MQKDSPLTIEKLKRQIKEERRKTLGYFPTHLRDRAALDSDSRPAGSVSGRTQPASAQCVSNFRVDSVHPEGREIARSFLDGFIHKTVEAQKMFLGLARAWQEQTNIDVPWSWEHELFAEIARR